MCSEPTQSDSSKVHDKSVDYSWRLCYQDENVIDLHVEVVVDGQEGPIYDDGDREVIKPTQITS